MSRLRADAIRNLDAARQAHDLQGVREWKRQLEDCNLLLGDAFLRLFA